MLYYPQLVKEIASNKESTDQGQYGLFGQHEKKRFEKDPFTEIPEYSEDQLMEFEKEVIGFLISRNPMEKHKAVMAQKVSKKLVDLTEKDVNKTFIFAGIVTAKKVVKTKKDNSEMAFLQVNDNTGTIEVVIFPKAYKTLHNICLVNSVCLFKGKVVERDGNYSVIMDNAVNLDARSKSN
jgi:DNA polymerase-3 subunit alpha